MNNNERNGNNIGEKGKKALREGKNRKLKIIIDLGCFIWSSLFVNGQKTGDFDSLGRVASYESFSLV